jgi:predicted nucleic acid-binding protein
VALIVLDASVLIALLDPKDALHVAARAGLAQYAGDDLKLPASAYAESLVGPSRSGRLAAAKNAIGALWLEVVPITGPVAEEAAALRARHSSLRLPDALVIATGSVLGATVVLTGDARWRDLTPAIRVL